MTYAIFFMWNDGFRDTDDIVGAKNRDRVIKDMIDRNEFCEISYQAKYKNGSRGKTVKVL